MSETEEKADPKTAKKTCARAGCGKPARIKFCGSECERKDNAERWLKERAVKAAEKKKAATTARDLVHARRAAAKKVAKSRGCSIQAILDKHGIKRSAYDTQIYRGWNPRDENAEKFRKAGLYDALVNTGKKS